jgi:thioredoxin reductase
VPHRTNTSIDGVFAAGDVADSYAALFSDLFSSVA